MGKRRKRTPKAEKQIHRCEPKLIYRAETGKVVMLAFQCLTCGRWRNEVEGSST